MSNTFCISFDPSVDNNRDPDMMINDFFQKMYGGLTPKEIATLRAENNERNRKQLEKSKKEAMAMLRKMNRPVHRDDMLRTMEFSIVHRLTAYEERPAVDTAVMLLATIICKNLLLDGPLHEEA